MTERRKEIRYEVPEIYQKYITFKIKKDSDEFVPAELLDFSLKGIKIKIPLGLAVGSTLECLISIPKSLTKEILFSAKINYCIREGSDGEYLIGAEIFQTSDPIWLNLFSKVHDFISQRIGKIF